MQIRIDGPRNGFRMTPATSAPDSRTARVRVCPQCSGASPAAARLCARCLHFIGDVEPIEQIEAVPEARGVSASEPPRASRRRWRWYGVAVAVLVLTGAFPRDSFSAALPTAPGQSSVEVAGDVWSGPGGGTAGSRATTALLPAAAAVDWQFEAGAEVVALGADAERVYVSLSDARLVALDAGTGAVRWTIPVPGQLDEPPAIVGDVLYISLRSSGVAAVDAATGNLIWSRPIPSIGFVWSSPLVVDGQVWVTGQRAMHTLAADDGRLLRVAPYDRMTSASPVLAENYVAMATTGRQLVFDQATGARTFNYPLRGILHVAAHGLSTVVLTERAMASTRADASAHWWEGERLRTLWTNAYAWGVAPEIPPPVREWNIALPAEPYPPAMDGALVFLADVSGAMTAYRLQDGSTLWKDGDAGAIAAPVLTPDGVLVPTAEGLRLLDHETGEGVGAWALDLRPADVVVTAGGTYIAGVGVDGEPHVLALR